MSTFLLGLATGTLISGLVTKYYGTEPYWIKPAYILVLSAILFILFLFVD